VPVLSKKWFVIINPISGNGKSKKKWPEIKKQLEISGFDFEFAFTKYSKHSSILLNAAIEKGVTNIICIGGDGTLHNIVNGIMNQKILPTHKITVGMIPIGTGNDWVKTHNISKNVVKAIRTIEKGNISTQDVGKIAFTNNKNQFVFFNNLAGIGFDGFVTTKVVKYKHFGSMAYLIGAVIGLFSFKNFNSKVYTHSKCYSGKTLMILIGLGRFSGGGMQLTKTPNPFDSLFDISIAKDLSKLEIIKNLGKLYSGKITNNRSVLTAKSNTIKIDVEEKLLPFIQADGEVIGTGNISITIVPKAFSFYC
jgi:YegS/Rv2252/BmrU family lipid kinase